MRQLGEKNRREPLAPFDRRLVIRSPRVKKLDKLFAGAVVIPFAIAPGNLNQMIKRLLAASAGIERKGKIKSRLVIKRVGCHFLLEFVDWSKRSRLFSELDRSASGGDRSVTVLA